MHKGDLIDFTTAIGRHMTALVLSDTAIAEPVGYVFIAPVLNEPRSREHVTAPIAAADGYAILWRMQSVAWDSLTKGELVGRATDDELNEIDEVLAALLGLSTSRT